MVSNSSLSPFRVAILGTGNIVAPHAAALKSLSGVRLVAVCDLDETRARACAHRWGIPGVYTDLATMLEHEKPDSVHILLPPTAHAWACQTCLAAGCHIFVEKPFCDTRESCERVRDLAERSGLRVGVSHNYTYMPGLLRAVDLARNNSLGAIEHVSVYLSLPNQLGRGPLNHWMFTGTDKLMLEIGPHPISLIYRFLGKVTSCSALASGEMLLANGTRFFHTWQASLACERGTGQFLLSVGKGYLDVWIHVIGQDGEVFIDLRRATVRVVSRSSYRRTGYLREDLRNAASLARQSLSKFTGDNLAALGFRPPVEWQDVSIKNGIADFYSAMASGAPTPMGAEEGLAVVTGCEMVIEDAMAKIGAEAVHCA